MIIIVKNMMLMFVNFQADTNPVQVLCPPSWWGQQCLTNTVVHIREEYRDTQSRGMTGNRSDREGGCCKHDFPMAAPLSLSVPLHTYIVNTRLFFSTPPSTLSMQGQLIIQCRLLCYSSYQFWLHLILCSDKVNASFMWLAWVNNI